jgi:hypothetical protein
MKHNKNKGQEHTKLLIMFFQIPHNSVTSMFIYCGHKTHLTAMAALTKNVTASYGLALAQNRVHNSHSQKPILSQINPLHVVI